MRRLVRASVACVLATAVCLAVTVAPAPADGTPRLRTYRSGFLTLLYPAAWLTYSPAGGATLHVTPLLDLSTEPMRNPCRPGASDTRCGWPVDRLAPGGVLVVFENRVVPGWTLRSALGVPLRVGGRSARRATAHPGICSAVAGDETIRVAVRRPLAGSWTLVTACFRKPGIAASKGQFAALLATTRFLAP
jgi:hypothetical protein